MMTIIKNIIINIKKYWKTALESLWGAIAQGIFYVLIVPNMFFYELNEKLFKTLVGASIYSLIMFLFFFFAKCKRKHDINIFTNY